MPKNKHRISASLSCCDILHLADSLKQIEDAGIDFIHYDVVDGKYNNVFVFGDLVLSKVHAATPLPVEVHLACEEPEVYIEPFARAGASYIAVHYESLKEWRRTFSMIREAGAVPVLALRAETDLPDELEEIATEIPWFLILTVNPGYAGQKMQPKTLDKIHRLRQRLNKAGLSTGIQADGNINPETIPLVTSAGADILTGGTSGLFRKDGSVCENADQMRAAWADYKEEMLCCCVLR